MSSTTHRVERSLRSLGWLPLLTPTDTDSGSHFVVLWTTLRAISTANNINFLLKIDFPVRKSSRRRRLAARRPSDSPGWRRSTATSCASVRFHEYLQLNLLTTAHALASEPGSPASFPFFDFD